MHLIRFHGVLAPNAKLRPLVVPQGPEVQEQAIEVAVASVGEAEAVAARPHRISWARLLKRVFDIDMQHCPNCGAGELKIIAAILERPVIEKGLTHLVLQPQPTPRRGTLQDRARLCRLSRVRRRRHIAKGCNGTPQPEWPCAPCPHAMTHIGVNPAIEAKTATCERLETCRLDSHAHREAQLRVLQPSPVWPGACAGPC